MSELPVRAKVETYPRQFVENICQLVESTFCEGDEKLYKQVVKELVAELTANFEEENE